MAKSFKQLSTLQQRLATEPPVGRDFLDLLNGPTAPQPVMPLPVSEPTGATGSGNAGLAGPRSKTGELGNTAKPGKRPTRPRSADNPRGADNTTDLVSPESGAVTTLALPPVVSQPVEEGTARQTFVVSRHLLERLRDYVHARRARGDYAYSQKQALEEALIAFLAAQEPAQPRPPEAHEREQQFRTRVREGRQSSAAVESRARSVAPNS
jgi:hypothetical protein